MDRLISGLTAGDPTAVAVLTFAVTGTVVIWFATRLIRRRRESTGHRNSDQPRS